MPTEFDEFRSPRITLWRLTRAEIEHENTLTHHRTTWLLSSQGFLYAVFGLIITAWMKDDIKRDAYLAPAALLIIATYASYLCFCFHDSLDRAHRQLKRLQEHYKNTLPTLPACDVPVPPLQHWDKVPPLRFGRTDSIAAATLLVWISLLVLSALLLSFQNRIIVSGTFIVAALLIVVGALCRRSAMAQRDEVTDTEINDSRSK
jgi:hypothetical protein